MIYGTMIMEDQSKGGGDDEDDGDDYEYGTMVMSNGVGKGHDDEKDDWGDYDNGTMIYDAPPTAHDHDDHDDHDTDAHDELKGLFEGNDQINSVVHLPDHPTREELVEIKENLEQLFSEDLAK